MAEEEITETEETPETIEALAEQLGWNPNWEPDPDRGQTDEDRVSAKDYILKQQDIMRRSSEDIQSLKGTVDSMKGQMQEMAENQGKQLTRALESQKQRLMEERTKAVEEGDKEAFEKAEKELSSLDEPKETTNQRQIEFQKGYEKFTERNGEWWGKDWVMTGTAKNIAEVVGAANPNMPAEEFYATVEKEMKRAYPEKFSSPSNKPTQVSGDRPAKPKAETAWDKLNQEYPEIAEHQFSQFVKQGIYKDTKEDKEKYAKAVLEQ